MSGFGGDAGGEFIERLGIEIDLIDNASKAAIATTAELKTLNATADQIEKTFGKANAAANKLSDGLRKLAAQRQAVLGGGQAPGAGSPADLGVSGTGLTAFDKQLQSHLKLLHDATIADQKFEQSLQLKAAGVPQISAADKAIQSYGRTMALATKENENLAKSTDSGGNILKRFSGGLDSLNDKLKESGLSVRSISVLLGAGLAAGIAGVVRIVERLGKQLADFIGGEIELARQTQLSFGEASDSVGTFANNFAADLGASRDEALKTLNTFAKLGRELQVPSDAIAGFSEGLTAAAAALARSNPGFKGTEDAAKALEQALTGDRKALADLGVSSAQFAAEAQRDFGVLPDQLTQGQQAVVAGRLAIDAAGNSVREFGNKSKSALQAVKDSFKSIFGSINPHDLERVGREVDAIGKAKVESGSVFDVIDTLLHGRGQVSTSILEKIRNELRAGTHTEASKEITKAIDAEIDKRNQLGGAIDRLIGKYLSVADAQKIDLEAFKESSQAQQQAVQLIQALDKAVVEGNERVATAQQNVVRAQEDNATRSRDVAKRNADAILAANQAVDAAERSLTAARQDRAFRDQQAAENTAKAILDANRANRTAAENLTDFQREADRRVSDLQEKIQQLKASATQGLFDVQVQIINARLQGQNALANQASAQLAGLVSQGQSGSASQLKDAEKSLAREREDDAIKLSRLQRAQKETALDGIASVKKAQQEQSHAALEGLRAEQNAQQQLLQAQQARNRAYRDAADAIVDLNKTNSRAIADANKALADAQRQRDDAVRDASRALENFVKDTGLSIDIIVKLLQGMGLLDQKTLDFINAFEQSAIAGNFATAFNFMAGGDAPANTPFIWNEQAGGGSELLITPSGGTVVSHKDFLRLIALLEKNGGGPRIGQVVVNEVSQSPTATAWKVSNEIMRSL